MVREGNQLVESKMFFIPQLIRWQLDVKHGKRFSQKHLEGTKIDGTMFD